MSVEPRDAFDFLLETYATERLKTLTTWSQFAEEELPFRPAPLARTPREHMVHQCVSEDLWMKGMLGLDAAMPPLPVDESRLGFLHAYAAASARRLQLLQGQPFGWFLEPAAFFDVQRSRAWILTRRLVHSAHHRAQLTVYLRLLGHPLYSTYGPTADTGGLFQNRAPVIYRYASVEDLIEGESTGGRWPPLPGPGSRSPTERP